MYAATLLTWPTDPSWVELCDTPGMQSVTDRDEFGPGAVNWTQFNSLKVDVDIFLLSDFRSTVFILGLEHKADLCKFPADCGINSFGDIPVN